jgi:hypothetical protein
MFTAFELRSLISYVEDAYGTRAFAVYAACSILWTGWEGDRKAVLVQFLDGRRMLGMGEGTVPPSEIGSTLRQRITAYRQAIETEALLRLAGEKEG